MAMFFNRFFGVVIVNGSSMNPTLHDGQILVGCKKCKDNIAPGDIVVAKITRFDTRKEEIIIKRVIAVENQTISIDYGQVFINGEKLEEDYIISDGTENMKAVTIGEGEVFLLGDNRNNSLDSRIQGAIKLEDVLMKIL